MGRIVNRGECLIPVGLKGLPIGCSFRIEIAELSLDVSDIYTRVHKRMCILVHAHDGEQIDQFAPEKSIIKADAFYENLNLQMCRIVTTIKNIDRSAGFLFRYSRKSRHP